MSRLRRWLALTGATTFVAVSVVIVPPTADARDSGPDCNTQSESRQPVLLVHGYNSGASAWDSSKDSFANSATCVATFNYGAGALNGDHSTDWVTSPYIGKPLAQKIHQLAMASRSGGGTGKVIVVAHSMGGLATRCAVSSQCGEGSPFELRELITFDTPNHGTFLKSYTASDLADVLGPWFSANTCFYNPLRVIPGLCKFIKAVGTSDAGKAFTPGSDQLNTLPQLPGYIPDFAVAGSFPVTTNLFLHKYTLADLGDLVVARESALSEAKKSNGLGGEGNLVPCGTYDLITDNLTHTCWHGTETSYSGFVDQARDEITRVEAADQSGELRSLPGDCGHVATQSGQTATITVPAHSNCSTARDVVNDFYGQIRGRSYPHIPKSCGGAEHCGYLPGNLVAAGPGKKWFCHYTYPASTHFADCSIGAPGAGSPWDDPTVDQPITVDAPLQPASSSIPACSATLLAAAAKQTPNFRSSSTPLFLFSHDCYKGYAAGFVGAASGNRAAFVAKAENGKWKATVAGSALPYEVLTTLPIPFVASSGLLGAKMTSDHVRL